MADRDPVRPEPTTFEVPADGEWDQAIKFADGHTEAIKVPLSNPTVAEIVAHTVAVATRLEAVHGRVIGVMPSSKRFAMVARSETLRMQGRAN